MDDMKKRAAREIASRLGISLDEAAARNLIREQNPLNMKLSFEAVKKTAPTWWTKSIHYTCARGAALGKP